MYDETHGLLLHRQHIIITLGEDGLRSILALNSFKHFIINLNLIIRIQNHHFIHASGLDTHHFCWNDV